jgi:hypothetical protein
MSPDPPNRSSEAWSPGEHPQVWCDQASWNCCDAIAGSTEMKTKLPYDIAWPGPTIVIDLAGC